MNNTAVFIMPMKISGSETELRFLNTSISSLKAQTDKDWLLVIIDDRSDDEKVDLALKEIENDLKERVHVIRLEKNVGPGMARNEGIRFAHEIGAPFILFNDADDVSHPQRLEKVREQFSDPSVNVVYMSFDVIDENDVKVPLEKISLSVREIISGHKKDIIEGENAWIGISTRKNYTNLTSCTAVRTSLAFEEPFPARSVSEDSHTWLRYGAHPGKFVFLEGIKNHYRICSAVESRSRGLNADFYEKKMATDSDGFESAMKISKHFGRIKDGDEAPLRVAFLIREALSMLYGGSDLSAEKLVGSAAKISVKTASKCIEKLDCLPEYKAKLRSMLK